MTIAKLIHGTTNGYGRGQCRCPECRAAWAAYYRDWKARRRRAAGKPMRRVRQNAPGHLALADWMKTQRKRVRQNLDHMTERILVSRLDGMERYHVNTETEIERRA